jgi:hypothetical protein
MDLFAGAQAFQALAERLKENGETGLRRQLSKAVSDAAQPVAKQIGSPFHLDRYMPSGYVPVLAADLQVTTHTRAGGTSPGVTIFARAPTAAGGGRKIRQRNAGVITHPVFADVLLPRRQWRWEVQTKGMHPGFFDDPAGRAAPQVREALLQAMHDVAGEITRRT